MHEIKKIINEIEKRGYKVKPINDYKELNDNDTAIILLRKKGTIEYHWISLPQDKGSINFYGDKTLIVKVYLIVK